MELPNKEAIKKVVTKVADEKIVKLKKQRVRLEHEAASIHHRVRDIEWRIEGSDTGGATRYDDLMSERQRALDKLREIGKELLQVREQLIEEGVE